MRRRSAVRRQAQALYTKIQLRTNAERGDEAREGVTREGHGFQARQHGRRDVLYIQNDVSVGSMVDM